MTRQDEIRDSGRLAGTALAGFVGMIGDMQAAVTQRVEDALPPGSEPVMATHRAITSFTYRTVAAGHRLAAVAAAEVVHRRTDPEAPPPSESKLGGGVLPTINGLWGDLLQRDHASLAYRMAVRAEGQDVPLEPSAVLRAFPYANGRLVVFLHGLAETERSWDRRPGSELGDHRPYAQRLQQEHGLTPVFVRYNAGLRISDNGASLARLLSELVEVWPTPVTEISFVGHSMGGLVARSTCAYAERHQAAWVPRVRTVVTLGTPHHGAPLEKAVHVAEWLLRQVPETEPLSRVLGMRSVGVQDLRYGSVVEEDWFGHDPEEFLQDRRTEVAFLPHTTYCFVAASLTRDPQHPAGRLLGDGLVRHPSATGTDRTSRVPFEIDDGAHLHGVNHLALLNHPAVYEHLERWLAPQDVELPAHRSG